jgi:ribosomal protein S8
MLNIKKIIHEILVISKPGRKVYLSVKELENHAFSTNSKSLNQRKKKIYLNIFFDTWVLSTSKGILTRKEALKQKVGGELLFCIR